MSESVEARFAALVARAAPPERDPLFRLAVMERRERDLFRRRSQALAIAGVVAMLGASLAPLWPTAVFGLAVLSFGVAISATSLIVLPRLLSGLRRPES